MPLDYLPPELYSVILLSIPEDERQSSTLALSRAIPNAPIPTYHLFTRIRLCHRQRIVQLYHRIRKIPEDAKYVEDLSLHIWDGDGNVTIHLLRLLQNVRKMSIFVGPDMTPELLYDAFKEPRTKLESLSLRFRPYVRRVNYLQFLKGAYFDSSVDVISTWPKGRLHRLSLVQELPNDFNGLGFAQPLVFFTFKPFVTLSTSIVAGSIRQLRISIPSRDIVPFITSQLDSLKSLEMIDVSASLVSVPQIKALLARFPRLRHIIADSCNGFTRIEAMTLWHALGRAFAFAAIERAAELDNKLKTHVWLQGSGENPRPEDELGRRGAERRIRPGRRGVATATISLREPRVTTVTNGDIQATASTDRLKTELKVKVLPYPSSLVSLSVDAYAKLDADQGQAHALHESFRQRFRLGWDEGVAMLRAIWKRMQISHTRGTTRVFVPQGCVFLVHSDDSRPTGKDNELSGCVPVGSTFDWEGLIGYDWPYPTLCCAGSSEDKTLHEQHCGHFRWDEEDQDRGVS